MMDMPNVAGVQFRLIPGFTCYAVGSDGTVWSKCGGKRFDATKWRRLSVKQRRAKFGLPYSRVCLRADNGRGRVLYRYVHRLVLEAFVGPCPPKHQTRHMDGDVFNNNLANLAWGTIAENAADRALHGTLLRGEKVHCSKLTAEQVRAIRVRAKMGDKHKLIANEYGVKPNAVTRIVKRQRWKHVTD